MPRRRGWGWSNKFGFLVLEVNGVPSRVFGNYGDEKLNSVSDVYGFPYGTAMQLPDGRVFKYSLSGEGLPAGALCQNPTAVANDDMDLQVAATTVGSTTIIVTTAATIAADLYKDGYLYTNDGTGEGHLYRIDTNEGVTGAVAMNVYLAAGDFVAEELAASGSTLVGLKKNPYNGSLVYNTTEDGIPRGVAATEITSGYYCWLQTWGDACVLTEGTVVLGKALAPGTGTTGSIAAYPITLSEATPNVYTDGDKIIVGWQDSPIAADDDSGHIFLTIAP